MTVDFSDCFWSEGQKTSGIEVLFQNAKSGVATTKEVAEFLKERYFNKMSTKLDSN
jgi:hypothetical protein